MRILVLGAGAWGTALAATASGLGRHAVTLWARDPVLAQCLQSRRSNSRYLPGLVLPEGLSITSGVLQPVLQDGTPWDLVIIATPMAGLRSSRRLQQRCRALRHWRQELGLAGGWDGLPEAGRLALCSKLEADLPALLLLLPQQSASRQLCNASHPGSLILPLFLR